MRVVRRIQAERAAGWSLTQIATGLNKAGVRAKRGRLWYPSTVRYILLTHGDADTRNLSIQ